MSASAEKTPAAEARLTLGEVAPLSAERTIGSTKAHARALRRARSEACHRWLLVAYDLPPESIRLARKQQYESQRITVSVVEARRARSEGLLPEW